MTRFLEIPKDLLPQRYDCSEKTIYRRRVLCGHDTTTKSRSLPLTEIQDLDDLWIATNKTWGLRWTEKQFLNRVINKRLELANYNLTDYLSENPINGCKTSLEVLKRANLSEVIESLQSSINTTITIQAIPL